MQLGNEVYQQLIRLAEITDLYIFSGVIRNFFLKKKGLRDIDIVLGKTIDVENFFAGCHISKNSFGGYKIYYGQTAIDLWYLNDTWALRQQPHLDFEIEKYIPGTAFFNFSAIIYSFNEARFYANHQFLRFLQNKKIDIVHEPNANLPLCVINTLYYEDKFSLRVADRMKRHILNIYKKQKFEYKAVQEKHFGSVLYSDEQINKRMSEYATALASEKKSRRRNILPLLQY